MCFCLPKHHNSDFCFMMTVHLFIFLCLYIIQWCWCFVSATNTVYSAYLKLLRCMPLAHSSSLQAIPMKVNSLYNKNSGEIILTHSTHLTSENDSIWIASIWLKKQVFELIACVFSLDLALMQHYFQLDLYFIVILHADTPFYKFNYWLNVTFELNYNWKVSKHYLHKDEEKL